MGRPTDPVIVEKVIALYREGKTAPAIGDALHLPWNTVYSILSRKGAVRHKKRAVPSGMRECYTCHRVRKLSAFSKNRRHRDGISLYCRECLSKKNKFQRAKPVTAASHRADTRRRATAGDAVLRAAKDVPCADCGVRYPHFVMDFDHRPNEAKSFLLGNARCRKIADIEAEIRKCDVVCANCHRFRTDRRRRRE